MLHSSDLVNSFLDSTRECNLIPISVLRNSKDNDLAWKWQAVKVRSPKKVSEKGAFYYINHHDSDTSSGPPDSTALNFEGSCGRKELYTSKESPITCRSKAILKLEESLS